MLPGKDGAVCLVASRAERCHVIFQEEFPLGGSMRFMACNAPLFHGVVLEFDLSLRLSHLLVAIEAERIARLEKIELAVGRMRIVTLHATPFHNDLVCASRGGWDHGGMTVEADFGCVSFQELAMGRSVGIVTTGAFPIFQRGMDKALL